MPVPTLRSDDEILIIAHRVADDDDATPDRRSWQMPCAFCGSRCWVDPDGLLGSDFVRVEGVGPTGPVLGADVTMDGRRKITCVWCLDRAADAYDEMDALCRTVFARTRRVWIEAINRRKAEREAERARRAQADRLRRRLPPRPRRQG